MKSLEIVNKEIELIESELQKIENEEDTLFPFGTLMNELEKYSQIKQDLEVLEIIYKKDVDIRELKLLCFGILNNGIGTIEDTLKVYNNARSPKCQLTLEELLKLKKMVGGE